LTGKGSLALVTGATSGIGKALCFLLAAKGINLIATGRDAAKLQELKEALTLQVQVHTVAADLLLPEQRRQLIERIHQLAPTLVINNAGFGLYGECLTTSTAEQLKILEVDVAAVLEITLEAARTLVSKNQEGTIVNVSSAAGFQIYPGFCVYAAAKGFVNQFSRSFDYEMRPHGVRVLTICPGWVKTNFQKQASQGKGQNSEDRGAMTPEFIAHSIWQQIQTQKPLNIVDWRYRWLTYLSYFFPTSWSIAVLKKNIHKRMPTQPLMKIDI
jgi:short-subunit dehydrogenase